MTKHISKIAIMTWHHTNNYGTALQAYALKTFIEKNDCKVDLIDCRRSQNTIQQKRLLKQLLEYLLHKINLLKNRQKKHFIFKPDTFNNFYNKNFTYTNPCIFKQDLQELNEYYDYFICGSDQIWNPENLDPRFYLDFVKDTNKLIAYAPSLGITTISNSQIKKDLIKLTSRFKKLSLREECGCTLIKKLTNRTDIFNAIDPVFLLPKEEWLNLADKKFALPSNSMLIYYLNNNDEYFEYAINLAKEKQLKPFILHSTQSEDNEYANADGLTPEEFLSAISQSEFVCTDSFHVTAFSIIFNKQFLAFNKENNDLVLNRNNRIHELLNRLKIKNHVAIKNLVNQKNYNLDYSKVLQLLQEIISSSKNYLINSLIPIDQESTNKIINDICPFYKPNTYCNGEQTKAYQHAWESSNFIHKFLLKLMATQPFTLQEKCYGCNKYKNYNKYFTKPLFYNNLNNRLSESPQNLGSIFIDYYISYILPSIFTKLKSIIRKFVCKLFKKTITSIKHTAILCNTIQTYILLFFLFYIDL